MRSGHVVMVEQKRRGRMSVEEKRAAVVIMLEHMCFMQQQLILKNAEWGWQLRRQEVVRRQKRRHEMVQLHRRQDSSGRLAHSNTLRGAVPRLPRRKTSVEAARRERSVEAVRVRRERRRRERSRAMTS